ncbi:vitamin K epoxide reductase family protein [Sphingobacterium chungjuense]|uniref:vitamin K epoxide reductase family protein n=1 Tax=Sphingobacterium chungjuense TaxID=2675553 RepID=UPI00140E2627|nr:vitamin K epoxide reductase family protein [Sphingobacterium chungjuense]
MIYSNNFLVIRNDYGLKESISRILKHFGVKFSLTYLTNLIDEHVDFPSLLVFRDVLLKYNIKSIALQTPMIDDYRISYPCVCLLKDEIDSTFKYVEVLEVVDGYVYIMYGNNKQPVKLSVEIFKKLNKGVALVFDGSGKQHEHNFKVNRKKEFAVGLSFFFPIIVTLVFLLLISINTFFLYSGQFFLYKVLWIVFGSMGLLVALLLFYKTSSSSNESFTLALCSGDTQNGGGCDSVLESKYSKLFGISWTVYGLSYSIVWLIIQFLAFFSPDFTVLSFWLSIFSFAIVLISLYVQGFLIRSWCKLCLLFQLSLLANFLVSLYVLRVLDIAVFDLHLFGFVSIVLVYTLLIGVVKRFADLSQILVAQQSTETTLKRLRKDKTYFDYLQSKEKSIEAVPENLGIVLGNKEAKNEIIKVCNPYCTPCAQVHRELTTLLKNNSNLKVRILFNATTRKSDRRYLPVANLLAIYEQKGEDEFKITLEKWFGESMFDMELIVNENPLVSLSALVDEKMFNMWQWCKVHQVTETPTLFFNNKKIPKTYTVLDIETFF